MILITLTETNKKFASLTVKGHANSGEYGKDLVCSAVSAVIIGGINALKNPNDFEIKLESGFVEINAKNIVSSENQIVINTMMIQLETIEESEPKRIKIVKKGK